MKIKLPSSSKKTITKKQRDDEALISYNKLVAKWDKVPKFARGAPRKPDKKLVLDMGTPNRLEIIAALPSRVTPGASTAKKDAPQYTGTEILGIGQMHKSNSVPIFSKDEAINVARMRR